MLVSGCVCTQGAHTYGASFKTKITDTMRNKMKCTVSSSAVLNALDVCQPCV